MKGFRFNEKHLSPIPAHLRFIMQKLLTGKWRVEAGLCACPNMTEQPRNGKKGQPQGVAPTSSGVN